MSYDIKSIIDAYGYSKARDLVMVEGVTLIELQQSLGFKSKSRLSPKVYAEILKYLGIEEIPYKKDSTPGVRKFKLEQDRVLGNYWESDYIVDFLNKKLSKPIVNMSGAVKRYVISCPRHPKADPDSNQIKAHIVVWEINNKMFVPEDHWVVPIDGNYTNIAISNLELRTAISVQSTNSIGTNNPMYLHGMSGRHKHGGWGSVSRSMLDKQNWCSNCLEEGKPMAVHHIINYHLFPNPVDAHTLDNLLVLCQSCHIATHLNNTNIKALIEATQYSKLLELLETLKSQVPDTLIEIYKDVEKQLGLTDNQQPST